MKEVDYFKESLDLFNTMLNDNLQKMKDVTDDYTNIKKIVLDYGYQFGKMKAFKRIASVTYFN